MILNSSLIVFRLFTYFLNLYQKVTQSTEAWVLTEGINKGLAKYIGQALKEVTRTPQSDGKHAVCIGLIPCKNVSNRKELVESDNKKTVKKVRDSNVEINHTHVLLVDNNYAGNNGNLIDFSTKIVTTMRNVQFEGTIFFLYASVILKNFFFAYLFTHSLTIYLNLIWSRKCEFISYYFIQIF